MIFLDALQFSQIHPNILYSPSNKSVIHLRISKSSPDNNVNNIPSNLSPEVSNQNLHQSRFHQQILLNLPFYCESEIKNKTNTTSAKWYSSSIWEKAVNQMCNIGMQYTLDFIHHSIFLSQINIYYSFTSMLLYLYNMPPLS